MEGSSDPLEAAPVKLLLCENHRQVTLTKFEVSTYLYGLVQRVYNVFPQSVICLFLTISAPVSSAEQSFSKLKPIKSYLRNTL